MLLYILMILTLYKYAFLKFVAPLRSVFWSLPKYMCWIMYFVLIEMIFTIANQQFENLYFVHRWWAPSKFDPVKSPMLFFEKDQPIIPPISPDVGLDRVIKHMVQY